MNLKVCMQNMQLPTGDELTLPPVILLKPGKKSPNTHEVPRHTSSYYIFDPNQIASNCLSMKAIKINGAALMCELPQENEFELPPACHTFQRSFLT